MPLTKADLNDATMLIKAGNTNAARRILQSSNDPRAITLLAQFDARFPTERAARPADDLAEVKRLIAQKKFAAAEALLKASSHPKASHMLQRVALLKTMPKPAETPKPRRRRRNRSFWRSASVMLSGLFASFN